MLVLNTIANCSIPVIPKACSLPGAFTKIVFTFFSVKERVRDLTPAFRSLICQINVLGSNSSEECYITREGELMEAYKFVRVLLNWDHTVLQFVEISPS